MIALSISLLRPSEIAWVDLPNASATSARCTLPSPANRATAVSQRRRPARLRATVGVAADGPLHLDLRAQGPHALVGGTTGSGKSEFLQAWVLAMAAEYSPDRVTSLFVDYKGGAAFADCMRVPHCVGLVTDLSPHLVRRALTSLQHREHLLNKRGAKDLPPSVSFYRATLMLARASPLSAPILVGGGSLVSSRGGSMTDQLHEMFTIPVWTPRFWWRTSSLNLRRWLPVSPDEADGYVREYRTAGSPNWR